MEDQNNRKNAGLENTGPDNAGPKRRLKATKNEVPKIITTGVFMTVV